MTREAADRLVRLIRFLVGSAALVGLTSSTWHRQIDDQFISITYAHQLATAGLLEHSSGERVEGYSNFLYTLLLSGAMGLGFDAVLVGKIICLLSGIAIIAVCSVFAPASAGGSLFVLAVATWEPISYWSSVGLETTLYAALLTGGWAALLSMSSLQPAGIALLGVAALTRNEGAVHLMAAAACAAAIRPTSKAVRASLAVTVTILVTYHLGRSVWFGNVVPTPVLVKISNVPLTLYGLRQASGDLVSGVGLIAAALLSVSNRPRQWLLASAPLLIQTAILWRLSGDWMSEARFVLPGLCASAVLWVALGSPRAATGKTLLIAAVIPLGALWAPKGYGAFSLERRPAPRPRAWDLAWLRDVDTPLQEDLSWVTENVPDGSTIFVVDAGILGLIPGVRLIDARGLNTRRIAKAEAEGRTDAEINLMLENRSNLRPDYFRVAHWGKGAPEPIPANIVNAYAHVQTVRYIDGTISWFYNDPASPPPEVVWARWEQLREMFPSLSHVVWRATVARLEAGEPAPLAEVAADAERRWPTDRRFTDLPESASFPGSPDEVVWVSGRGTDLPQGRTLQSRRLNVAEIERLKLSVDTDASAGSGVSLRVAVDNECGSVETSIMATGREAHRLPFPEQCPHPGSTRISVTSDVFDNMSTVPSHCFVSLTDFNSEPAR